MKSNNSLNPLYFQFTLFADFGPLRYLFFSLCLLLYMTIVSANIVIILTVCLEKSLHQPMYIFICSLCFNSLYGSAGFFPRFLMDILSDTHLISRPLCFIQMYVIYTYASCVSEFFLLSVMAYDRYVSICKPLQYPTIVRKKTVNIFLILAWTLPASVLNIYGLIVFVIAVPLPVLFILFTYTRILIIIYRSSREVRRKAAQTCLPHLLVLINFSCLSTYDTPAALKHILVGCKTSLIQGLYTWWHNQVLWCIAAVLIAGG
ncbi:olfactory receptor 13F1-like [Sander vitreus]